MGSIAGLKRLNDSLRRRMGGARKAALRAMVEAAFEPMIREAPRDTNRFVRGWIMAARDVKATRVAVPAVKPSRYRAEILAILEGQVAVLARALDRKRGVLDRWYTARGRSVSRGYGARLRREVAAAERRLRRAVEELAKARGESAALLFDAVRGGRRVSTVRERIYGGSGAYLEAGGRVFARLHNKEPHARIVERRTGLLRRANSRARRAGLRRAGRSYLASLQGALARRAEG